MTTGTADLNPHIVEALYGEALVLADEVRTLFDMSGRLDEAAQDEDLARIAHSCEALRTTTRMMHAIGWLLNQRAYFRGELSEFQLRRHGRLPRSTSRPDPENIMRLDADTRSLIVTTERFYARIERLERAWQQRYVVQPGAIHRLRERLSEAVHHI